MRGGGVSKTMIFYSSVTVDMSEKMVEIKMT